MAPQGHSATHTGTRCRIGVELTTSPVSASNTSTGGLTFAPAEFEDHVIEEQVPHSTALHARLAGRGRYLTGPTARYNLSRQWLSPVARQAA